MIKENEKLEQMIVSQDEQLFSTPGSWVWTKIGNVMTITGGSQPPKKLFINEAKEGYTRLVQIRDFKSDDNLTYIPDEFANRLFNEDNIMIGRYGPPVFQILRGLSGSYNVALMKAEAKKDILTKDYMYYLLQSSFIQKPIIKDSQRSAGQSGVRRDLLESLPIPVPPLDEQKRITKKIEASNEVIDAIQKKLTKAKELLNKRHESLLRKAFKGNLLQTKTSNVLNNWKWSNLGDIARVINGRAYKKEELLDEGPIPVLRVGNLFTSTSWYYSDHLELPDDKYCDKGDLLYAWSASFGPRIWEGPRVIYHYHIWKIDIIDTSVEKKFLYYFLEWNTQDIKSNGHGTSMLHITKGGMEKTLIPIPPLEEQRCIAERLEKEFQIEKETLKLIEKAEQHLNKMRESLLNKALRGELVEQRPKEGTGLDLLKEIIEF